MNKRFIIIGVVVLVVIGLGIGAWLLFFSKPESGHEESGAPAGAQKELTKKEEETARAFAEEILKSLQEQDYSKMYNLLTEEDRAKISESDFIKQRVEDFTGVTMTGWEIKEVLEEEDGASVRVVVESDSIFGHNTESIFLPLLKRDGKWFLSLGAARTVIEKGVGDEVELATIKFKVNKVEEKQVLTKSWGDPTLAKENAKFVVVDMNITNITKTSMTFPDEAFVLIDNQERQYEIYSNTIGSIDNYLNMRTLAPSIMESGVIVFEIPQDATSYSITIAKAETNEAYKVILR